ncbi:MAG: hypothetical protein UR99_C0022G0002 [Candidatus Moranbacteria bacterium GW2011_GWD2_36_12]|nr:MAG: hypothetical protein UR99_C0022G0002 [Candidatus Moranbacteria bacterium GW2011_GWD2_36_12]KKQ06306.1 MAG: hypothetical protein US16_C0019G0002 [Candidatus Moranbacteria bacterium GW2011_GWE2_36_40]
MAHAYDVVAQQQAPAHVVEKSEQSALTASGVTAAVEKAVRIGMTGVSAKIENIFKKKDSETSKSINAFGLKNDSKFSNLSSAVQKVGADVKNLDNKLTGKGGEFEKNTANVNEVKAAVKAVDSSILWMTIAIVVVIVVMGLGIVLLLKKGLNRVEGKVDNIDVKIDDIPADTAERVLAFDRSSLNVVVGGHDVVFLQDDDTLNKRVYQILLVDENDITPATTPVTYELQVMARRDKAEDSLRRTMREYLNGKLAAKTDAASLLTIKLIAHYESIGKLSIMPTS